MSVVNLFQEVQTNLTVIKGNTVQLWTDSKVLKEDVKRLRLEQSGLVTSFTSMLSNDRKALMDSIRVYAQSQIENTPSRAQIGDLSHQPKVDDVSQKRILTLMEDLQQAKDDLNESTVEMEHKDARLKEQELRLKEQADRLKEQELRLNEQDARQKEHDACLNRFMELFHTQTVRQSSLEMTNTQLLESLNKLTTAMSSASQEITNGISNMGERVTSVEQLTTDQYTVLSCAVTNLENVVFTPFEEEEVVPPVMLMRSPTAETIHLDVVEEEKDEEEVHTFESIAMKVATAETPAEVESAHEAVLEVRAKGKRAFKTVLTDTLKVRVISKSQEGVKTRAMMAQRDDFERAQMQLAEHMLIL